MNDKYKIHQSHNLYILGAGFSRAAGLPLIADFLDQMRDSVDWLLANKRPELKAVEDVFKFRLKAAGAAYRSRIEVENIGELFSLASASEGSTNTEYVSSAIAATLDYARAINEPPVRSVFVAKQKYDWQFIKEQERRDGAGNYKVPVYDINAGIISGAFCERSSGSRNTVISFNYDTLLEDSLERLKIPYNYHLPLNKADYHSSAKHIGAAFADPTALPVLKLHGSVNWAIKSNSDTNAEVSVYSDYSKLLTDNNSPYLLPPTWRKVFAGALTSVWNKALESISQATRIIVIGFSMPPTDLHFRYLLAAGLRDNISLREMIFINKGDCTTLQDNLNKVFQSPFTEKIQWFDEGAHATLTKSSFLSRIDRKVCSDFGHDPFGLTY